MKADLIALAAALSFCAGCKVGPKYSVPVAPAPPAYREQAQQLLPASKDWAAATPEDAWEKGNWWEIYRDPELNALEQRIDVNNQSLKSAEARFVQARAFVHESRSSRMPTVSAGGTVARDRLSMNQGVPPPASEAGFGNFDLGAFASWEPDLWGRIRTLVDASVENAQASAADLENVRLSLHAELALDYFELRSLDNEKKVLEDSVAAFQKALELTEHRYDGGLANRAEVEEARAQLEAASAQEVDISNARVQCQDALAVLTGQVPEGFSIAEKSGTMTPPAIPAGVPSALLQRRPDIAAAERRVALANSQAGLAHAAFYPQVILSSAIGLQGMSLEKWFAGPSRFWAVGPSVAQTIFDAGRRRAGVAQANANYDEVVAEYRQNVLTAFRQVEDNLASLRILDDEAARQERAVAASRNAEELSMNRYRGGLVTYLEVVTAQSTRLQNERVAIGIERRRMEASVLLIRALGGGWNASSLPNAATIATSK
jgi:NodT family efflux transporter outer membrane factor (OMF) lipoprotein